MNDNELLEFWKDISGYEGLYQVSNFGRMKRLPIEMTYSNGQRHFYPEKIYKFSPTTNGYYVARLRNFDGEVVYKYLHRLVAETFLPMSDGLDIVNHIDSDKTNNNVSNLEWVDQSGNCIHAIHQYGEIGSIKMRPVVCVETGQEFESSSDAARWLEELTSNIKASSGNIWSAASGTRPTALGFHWKFKEEI